MIRSSVLLAFVCQLAALTASADPNITATASTSRQICSVPNGLEVVRLVSGKTRGVFRNALEDVELLRETATEAMINSKGFDDVYVGDGFATLEELADTLDWQARGMTPNADGTPLTTLDAGLGYTDDRPDRRMDRYISLLNEPFIGNKVTDMMICETLSNTIPWIVDRQSKEEFWWRDHENGHSEGPFMEEKVVDQLYTGAWINTYGDALWYYPPLSVFGHPLTMGDIFGPEYDSHILGNGVVSRYHPWHNDRQGEAFLSPPYPDIAVPGLSMITAGAPLFFTGEFMGYTYNNTFLASIGIDITITAMSGLLDELDGTITSDSFAVLVDLDMHAIVISQPTVEKLFPPRTGMEEARITYDLADKTTIVQDRRNQTYLVSDTIVQPLTDLQNADWEKLQQDILDLEPGQRDYSLMNITMTGGTTPTLVYAMYERWPTVADWAVVAFAPVQQVDRAVEYGFEQDSIYIQSSLTEESKSASVVFVNSGTIDVTISFRSLPLWIQVNNDSRGEESTTINVDGKTLVKAGSKLPLDLLFLTKELVSGTTTTLVTLVVEDAGYSECFYSQSYSLEVTIEKEQVVKESDSLGAGPVVGIVVGGLVLIAALIFVYLDRKRRAGDSLWKVDKSELKFDDPPEIVGRGTFGMVLLAEYRGTQVAVKRVIPPKSNKGSGKHSLDHFNRGASSTDEMPEQSGKRSGDGPQSATNKVQPSGSMAIKQSAGGTSMALGFFKGQQSDAAKLSKLKSDFLKEMRILARLRHPCITTVMGAVTGKNEDPMLLMEYCEHGSLYDLLHNETMVLDGEILLPILRDVTQGLRFLHAAKPQIIHGDLKAANILVDSKFRGKVADFGLSQKESILKTASTVYGTPYWMAPELLRGESLNTTKSDVYSFGILLYETMTRKEPYEGEKYEEVLQLVKDPKVCKRPPIPEKCDAQIQGMMKDCLVDDSESRPTFEELDGRLRRIDVKSLDGNKTTTTVSLDDIFPPHIAKALREGKKIEPEHRDSVTIFFSDIVGFTTISSTLHPRKVANMLDRLYEKFDELSQKHDVFKVETIGDAYMAVTNLVKDQHEDHTCRIAAFAVDAIAAAKETLVDIDDKEKGFINIRVGFHSGAVVADVVGSKNRRYCLFGDTVNVASRMETVSKANCINCSEQAANLLKEQKSPLPVFPRGKVEVKGKGGMQCYWVNAKPTNRSVSPSNSGVVIEMLGTVQEQSERSVDGVNEIVDLDLAERGRHSELSL